MYTQVYTKYNKSPRIAYFPKLYTSVYTKLFSSVESFDFFIFSAILYDYCASAEKTTRCNKDGYSTSFYMKGSLEEKSLLYKVQTQKDPEAFALLYDEYVEPIYRFVYFKISHREEAEDVTGDVFLKCWQYLSGDKGKEIRSFSALLYTIARNQVIEVYRNRAKRPDAPLNDENDLGDKGSAARKMEAKEEVEKLIIVIRKLKQEYQEVLLLRYVEDFSIGEIAAITGKTQTSVRVTLHRALKKLKSLAEAIRMV